MEVLPFLCCDDFTENEYFTQLRKIVTHASTMRNRNKAIQKLRVVKERAGKSKEAREGSRSSNEEA
jgi:hypothetical protein